MQGPLALRLCSRCAADPWFAQNDHRQLLHAFDLLQAVIQGHVSEATNGFIWGKAQDAVERAVCVTVNHYFPDAALGIGASRVAVEWGPRLVAKVSWNQQPKWEGGVESNLLQAASWLAVADRCVPHLVPCFALSEGGVLWTRRATTIAPPNNPTRPPPRDLDDQTRDATTRHWDALERARSVLNPRPVSFDTTRANNWATLDNGGLVLVDTIRESPPGDSGFDERLSVIVQALASRTGDVSLDRAIIRPKVLS